MFFKPKVIMKPKCNGVHPWLHFRITRELGTIPMPGLPQTSLVRIYGPDLGIGFLKAPRGFQCAASMSTTSRR